MVPDLAYALVQVVHNLGAVAIVAGAIFALAPAGRDPGVRRTLAWVVLAGWLTQVASGATFGAISLIFHGAFPDLGAIATVALAIKVASAAAGIPLAALYLLPAARERLPFGGNVWPLLAGLGLLAISAAAFLRWFA
ncbi:MAG: hypothetical protein ACOZAI_07020 [Pseudomonadota bacterium]